MVHFNIDNYELVKYYGYTTTVTDPLVETLHYYENEFTLQEKYYKKFYDDCVFVASVLTQNKYGFPVGNKSAFQLRHKASGKTIFVGMYDNIYRIGLGINQYFGSRFDFNKMEWEKSLSETSRPNEY